MKRFWKTCATALVMGALFTGPLSSFASAASPSKTDVGTAGNGFRVSPVRTDLNLMPGQSNSLTVYITNVSGKVENLQVVANDFQSRDETGTPALLLNGQTDFKHGLKQFMTVPSNILVLQPGEQKPVTVQIKLPDNATAGGYYGAVRFLPSSANGNNTVNLSASVASLVLTRVSGTVKEQLSIASFQVTQGEQARSLFTNNKNLQVVVRFLNKGDVQEEPFGKVLLQKGSTTPGIYEINNTTPRSNVLPNSIRRFEVKLDKVGSFGKYTVEGSFGFGSKGQVVTATSTFYVIPLSLIITVIVIILLVIFLIFGLPRLLRAYNQRIIQGSSKRR